ncbi:transcription termination factor MTERF5, chloroplastic-like isoform X1 [Pistacia vera]|uniref:transcription termination factor MTERF5, chloroplastic-like isoform X1 n=1 Tax=Pistacia vera TaxID=55513 RepID=UPI001263B1E8|nr:transcription termination factor MTERF5, chloroplastic-like isoform X1 [Pistacia vera]
MQALCGSHSSDISSLCRGAFYIIRTQLTSPEKLFCCWASSFSSTDSCVHGSFNSRVEPPMKLAAEKEETKSVFTLFLKKQGLSKELAARTITRSDLFINHLVSRIHAAHRSRCLVVRELTNLEVRDTLIPYLESLLEEHGNALVNVVENFPDSLVKEKPAEPVSQNHSNLNSKKPKVVSQVIDTGLAADLHPQLIYLIELGMDHEQIKGIIRRYPKLVYDSLEKKIKPLVKFLLDLGVPQSGILKIICSCPQLCGLSLFANVIPTLTFLEGVGVDKKQWAKVIHRYPSLLTFSRDKVQAIVDFLYELGLSAESIGKILTRHPVYIGYSVEDKLKPMAKFFLERGFSIEEVGIMVSRSPTLYNISFTKSLIPKWEFLMTMGYSKFELVKFPQYFSYSLEERIKPRYALVTECGVKMRLNLMLSLSGCDFEKALKRKRKKMLSNEGSSGTDSK